MWNFRHHYQYAVDFSLPPGGLLKSLDADRLTAFKPVYKSYVLLKCKRTIKHVVYTTIKRE